MFRHIVCFKIAEDKKDQMAEAKKRLLSLRAIDEVKDIEVGLDAVHSGRSYDIALIVDFEDKAAYKAYDVHPLHQPVRKFMHGIRETSVAVDFDRD